MVEMLAVMKDSMQVVQWAAMLVAYLDMRMG